eukprot:TRINITY_DN8744_c0_g1_i1.p1 TRINITY_DN8744_c0_g1~~TRINITY_DN8744_c0_g1_i1.p1  ORF type:complete len:866 (-),score=248.54 TRINITY_DN8744_c0_g1_i1:151-2679(-)
METTVHHITNYNEYTVRKLAFNMLNFLSYIHKQGIVYGNLGLHNIVVKKKQFFVGHSIHMSSSKVHTNTLFAAPEIFTNSEYSTSSDIWAVGIILFILLVGDYPFSLNSYRDLKNGITNREVEITDNTISLQAKNFIMKLLTKKKNERPFASNCLVDEWFHGVEDIKDKDLLKEGSEHFSSLPKKIVWTCQKMSDTKLNKMEESKFSIITDILFEGNQLSHFESIYKIETPKRRSTNLMVKTQRSFLLVGNKASGKNEFVRKFILANKYIIFSHESVYINGKNMLIYHCKNDTSVVKWLVLDITTKNSYFNLMEGKSTVGKSKSQNIFDSIRKEEEEIDHVQNRYSVGGFQTKKENPVDSMESVVKNFEFHPEFLGVDLILFFANGAYFEDVTIDRSTMRAFKVVMNSCHEQGGYIGKIPVYTVIRNDRDMIKDKDREKITQDFTDVLPLNYQCGFSTFFVNSFSEESFRVTNVWIESFFKGIKQTTCSNYLQNNLKENGNYLCFNPIFHKFDSSCFDTLSKKVIPNKKAYFFELKGLMQKKVVKNILFSISTSHIQVLRLYECNIPKLSYVSLLCEHLKKPLCQIKELRIVNVKILSEDNFVTMNNIFLQIINSLFKNTSVETIDFSKNQFDTKLLERLLDLTFVSSISKIYLSACKFDEKALYPFVKTLFRFSNKLNTLDISNNNISARCINKLIKASETNPRLPLIEFFFTIYFNNTGLVERANIFLARNLKKITRHKISKEILDNKSLKWKTLISLSPISPFNANVLIKVFQKYFSRNKLEAKSLNKVSTLVKRKSFENKQFKEINAILPTKIEKNNALHYFEKDKTSRSDMITRDLS